MEKLQTKTKTRQAGLEILRIISILLITCVHMLNYGGFLKNAGSNEELLILRFLYSLFVVAVNVFVLICGYFMVKSNPKPKKIITLWLTVVFYSVTLYSLSVLIFKDDFVLIDFLKCFIPFLNNRYWFFSAYFALYILSPFLNKILKNSSDKELIFLTIIIFAFSFISKRFNADNVLLLKGGYNLIWFIYLYLIGGMLQLKPIKLKKRYIAIIYALSTLIIFMNFLFPTNNSFYKYLSFKPEYTDLVVLIASISIFLLFNNINLKNNIANKIIRIISSTTFGIYLLQEGILFKHHLYWDILKVNKYYGRIDSVLYILLFVLIVFVMGFIYDIIRQGIFISCKLIYKKSITALKNKHNKQNVENVDINEQQNKIEHNTEDNNNK